MNHITAQSKKIILLYSKYTKLVHGILLYNNNTIIILTRFCRGAFG